jgi:hypothetical protein
MNQKIQTKVTYTADYTRIGEQKDAQIANTKGATKFIQTHIHGFKAERKPDDLVEVGYNSK